MVDRIRQYEESGDRESIESAYHISRLVQHLADTASADLGDVSVLARIALRTIRHLATQHGALFVELAERAQERDQS